MENYFNNILGTSDGIILFSHYRRISDELIKFIFPEKKVKKVFVLNLVYKDPDKLDSSSIDTLEHQIISENEYSKFENEDNIIFEIRRKEYCL